MSRFRSIAFLVATFAVVAANAAPATTKQGVPPLPEWRLLERTATSLPMSTVSFAGKRTPNVVDFDEFGYVEEEYVITGAADSYTNDHARIDQPAAAYTTRVLVRRPKDPRRFSGSIQLEPIRDVTEWYTTWLKAGPYFMRHGDVWIGFTMSGPNVRDFLQKYDSRRYAALDIRDDGQRWDIMAQVAWLARSPNGVLGKVGLIREGAQRHGGVRVYSSGWSLTGCMQVQFINYGHHARWRTPNGGPLIDGYLPGICPSKARVALPADAAVIQVMSENEYTNIFTPNGAVASFEARQEQRDGKQQRFRWYDIAGTSHIDYIDLPDFSIVWRQAGMDADLYTRCKQTISTIASKEHFIPAFLHQLDEWVRRGTAPAPSRMFELNEDRSIARDKAGNALGGLQPHWVATPRGVVRQSSDESTDNAAKALQPPLGGICRMLTHIEAFPAEELHQRYPTPAVYRQQATATIQALVQDGLLLPNEASIELRDLDR